ncbi:MAG: glycosyltransferase family 4 protein [Candidatus Omnitrophota bacterium]|jgi:glycosyltransferase involved in cell wall biosynthesis|nr:MAG: glycosyltransferase family 4 protein [Candidatus Omnitrophota bacterium]
MNRLKIAITVDPEIPVPPIHYGGIERIVDMLVNGLLEKGHKVLLFANPASKVNTTLIAWRGKSSLSFTDTLINAAQLRNYLSRNNVDLIHSFSRQAYLLFLMRNAIPKIQSYSRHISPRSISLGNMLAGKSLTFTACSSYCAGTADFVGGRWRVIYNGVPLKLYDFNPCVKPDSPLVFLGRIEQIKGAHNAIEAALKSKEKLIIAGNLVDKEKELIYFENKIKPFCDNKKIKYIGPVDDSQKNELLRNAKALLFPIEWDEPFGMVMIESLACGTPVIAFRRGAVEEVIDDGVTGFTCDTVAQMCEAIRNINLIDRRKCRKKIEDSFSDSVIVSQYEQLYYELLRL